MTRDKAPQTLDDLVSAGYLKVIPLDPVTHSNSTWVPTMDDTLQNVDQTDPGMTDVHSGSDQAGERRTALLHLVGSALANSNLSGLAWRSKSPP